MDISVAGQQASIVSHVNMASYAVGRAYHIISLVG